MKSSPTARLVDLRGQPRSKVEKALASLSDQEAEALLYAWREWARPTQVEPEGDWSIWLVLAGRGFGKTRLGAEWIRERIAEGARRVALVAPTAADARDTMIEGESGLLAIYPSSERPLYEPSKRRVTWPNGAVATLFSADEPDRLRGPQQEYAWADELATWRYAEEAWANLMFGLRLGRARACVTTTPKPLKIIRELVARSGKDVALTRGRTYDNLSNLAPTFREQILSRYEGTRIGRQELDAEILDDVPGALWQRQIIESCRTTHYPDMRRIVVGVDPAGSNTDESDHTGILVCGLGTDGRGYVLDDLSLRASPHGWAKAALAAAEDWKADRIVAEKNNGGDMVEHTLRTADKNAPVTLVHASRGKITRAEPIAALYEQGKVSHVKPMAELEDEMCIYDGSGDSPDRLDAMVWAMTELMLGIQHKAKAVPVRGLV